MYTVSITSQGQMSIPAEIRRLLGLEKQQKALVSVRAGKMLVEPVSDFFDLAGSVKSSKKPLSSREIHDLFAKNTR